MNSVLREIVSLTETSAGKPGFLDALFGPAKANALQGSSVVIFGAGSLGCEMLMALSRNGVRPAAFCDNDKSKAGVIVNGLPVIAPQELYSSHGNSLIVIASLKHRASIARQLLDAGFPAANICCATDDAEFIYMYSMIGTQALLIDYEAQCKGENYLDFLILNQDKIAQAHDLLQDAKSRSLMITKLALLASRGSFWLFCSFIREFSESYREFGFAGYEGTPEDYYYFNNDVLNLADGEIYVDIGAYDGDTIETFLAACQRKNIDYEKIIAFEPDITLFAKLKHASATYPKVSCHRLGLWSETTTLRFKSSGNVIHDQAAIISEIGDTVIEVVSLDDFLQGEKVTLIKMDPGGNVIPQVLLGAANTIKAYRPKLAAGAYHGIGSIFEIPLLVNKLCPEYRISLRHNTCHLCDTDLFAICDN
jgi:FkbM family methyltransferase